MMALRITTWNVNGIRNPFQYQPWGSKKTFEAMFEILEADIVIFQETKIQRKDLRDDMVLVQGWDCYWSLPRHKKGYSGVVIYTKQSVCAPIRAEEGITGVLCPPNSSTRFSDLSADQQIGGYPTPAQLANSAVDAATVDSEGRCVILEFPAFVLLGVYSPANRDESRDEYRLGFLNLLDARIRNLVSMGKKVILTGDLNISREELDTANAETSMRKMGMTAEEYVSTSSRRLFNQLLEGGKVFGERDEGREEPVLWDICREFHPGRKGMFTCWEQKTNARPGNYGSRIDYVLCSLAMKGWFSGSNIQEGLMGSDHCPVYATMNNKVLIDGEDVCLLDVMNPTGMFLHGQRQREYSTKDILPLSGKLIPEFDGRRSIRDMFNRKPSLAPKQCKCIPSPEADIGTSSTWLSKPPLAGKEALQRTRSSRTECETTGTNPAKSLSPTDNKRLLGEGVNAKSLKRAKVGSTATMPVASSKGQQQSLKGFFKPKGASGSISGIATLDLEMVASQLGSDKSIPRHNLPQTARTADMFNIPNTNQLTSTPLSPAALSPRVSDKESMSFVETNEADHDGGTSQSQETVHDPVESKDSWFKLFAKPAAPRCEGHREPCVSFLTRKSGINCGRSFWMCPRPLGPTGSKERNTQWRCQTFIWCSDWNAIAAKNSVHEDCLPHSEPVAQA